MKSNFGKTKKIAAQFGQIGDLLRSVSVHFFPKCTESLILKSPKYVQLGVNLNHFGPRLDSRGRKLCWVNRASQSSSLIVFSLSNLWPLHMSFARTWLSMWHRPGDVTSKDFNNRNIKIWPEVGQVGPKWYKSVTFSYQSFSTFWLDCD